MQVFPELHWSRGHPDRWMIFVDGENLAIRGKTFAKRIPLDLEVRD